MIVVDAGGDLTNSIMGELMLAHAQQIGIAGVVINGAVRDYGWIRPNAFPVFAAGVTHRGPKARARRNQCDDRDRWHGDRAWRPDPRRR